MIDPQAQVFIVDDDEAVRNTLRLLVKAAGLNCTTCSSAQDFLGGYDLDQPGCVVLDVRMPGMTGLELQQILNLKGAVIPVIFITGHADVAMAVEAMKHGAFDFVQKPVRERELVDRARRALEKDRTNRIQLRQRDQIRDRLQSLTPREREILTLVTRGKPNKVMAGDLGVSQRTVEIHRARVMEKMGAESLAQLVRMVLDFEPQAAATALPGASRLR
jgi:two-component system, LuxR family, response regulator FixJ